jgi:hypothetical protein
MIHLAVLAVLYFLPTIIASNRGHGVAGTLLLNLFLGWTGIGWIIMLLWALLSYPRYYVHPAYYYPPNDWRRW